MSAKLLANARDYASRRGLNSEDTETIVRLVKAVIRSTPGVIDLTDIVKRHEVSEDTLLYRAFLMFLFVALNIPIPPSVIGIDLEEFFANESLGLDKGEQVMCVSLLAFSLKADTPNIAFLHGLYRTYDNP